jgi:hemerythrin
MIAWQSELEVGDAELDTQHKRLVGLVNSVYAAHVGASTEELVTALHALIDATAEHFMYEEHLMAKIGYPNAAEHGEHHSALLAQMHRFSDALTVGRYDGNSGKALAFLDGWLTSHTRSFDRDLARHLAG